MPVYVIADLHLSPARPEITRALAVFVQGLRAGDTLIIAGDLFDFYIGSDPQDSAQNAVRTIMLEAAERGIECCFQQGNRDFLLKQDEARQLGLKLLPECHVLPHGCGSILITHGDLLCSNDLAYQKFRRWCHQPWRQRLFTLLPLKIRRCIGARVRLKSFTAGAARADREVIGVVPATAAQYLQQHRCVNLIHGHIHELGSFSHEFPGEEQRLSLNQWGSHFSWVKIDDSGMTLTEHPLTELTQ